SCIKVNSVGDVIVSGEYTGVIDFDPGPGTYTMNAYGQNDVSILKLDNNGNFVWAKEFGGTNIDWPHEIELDASDNIYTTGAFGATVDFDPGPGTFTLSGCGASQSAYV